jgi:cell division protein FtsL
MVLLLVSAQALLAQGTFQVEELERREKRLEQEQAALRLQIAELSSPERISRTAREAGLVLPERIEILTVPGERAPDASASEPPGTLAIEPVPGGEG